MNIIDMIEIQLNGKPHQLKKSVNISNLLKTLQISEKKVAVEINGIVISKDIYKYHIINIYRCYYRNIIVFLRILLIVTNYFYIVVFAYVSVQYVAVI